MSYTDKVHGTTQNQNVQEPPMRAHPRGHGELTTREGMMKSQGRQRVAVAVKVGVGGRRGRARQSQVTRASQQRRDTTVGRYYPAT